MIFKCNKIKNVDKSVCTAEQKIAYNYAFSWYDIGKKIIDKNIPEFVKSESFYQIEKEITKDIKNNPKMQKYNIDIIIIAFRQGFKNYCENFFIATDYKKIGEVFKIPYQIV